MGILNYTRKKAIVIPILCMLNKYQYWFLRNKMDQIKIKNISVTKEWIW